MTDHAKLRWLQRGHDFSRSLMQAWDEAYEIETPITRGEARLHPPSETVLIATGSALVTVYNVADVTFTAERFVTCEDCLRRYDPLEDAAGCPWCGSRDQHGDNHDR